MDKSSLPLRITCILLTTIAISLCTPQQAPAQVYLEPGVGLRAFSGDAGDLLSTGLVFSGLVGYVVSDYISIDGKIDVGIHGAGSDLDSAIDGGLSLFFGSGFMVTPLKRAEDQQVTLGIGGHLGRGAIAWEYTPEAEGYFGADSDGLGAWVLEFGGYLGLLVSPTVEIKANLNYGLYLWDDETTEGNSASNFDGNALNALGSIAVHF